MSPAGRLRLAADGFEAELAPALGGRLTLLRHAGRDIVVPLPHDHADPLAWGKGGGYPLVPFHNRIENAQLSFDGAVLSLRAHPAAAPHSLHGPAQCRPWRLAGQGAGSATLALHCAVDADWPWSYEATQHFALGASGVTVTLALRNSSKKPMPAGLGWHPYFCAGVVTQDARFHWPFRPDYVPTGLRLEGAGPQTETRYLEDWSAATITCDDMSIVLTASPDLAHLVVHRAGDYVCLEAVTHVANGFNLAARGHAHTGMRVLAPGETMTATLHIAVR